MIPMESIFVLAGSLLTAGALIAYWQLTRPKNDTDVNSKMEFGSNIHSIGMSAIRRSRIDRVSIVLTHNGDGNPYSGIPLYARQAAHMTDDKHAGKRVEFDQPVRLDLETVSLLNEIRKLDIKCRILKTSELPSKSLLRLLYEEEGVKVALLCYLEHTKYVTYFCSFACYESDTLNDNDINVARMQAEKFRTEIRRLYGKSKAARLRELR